MSAVEVRRHEFDGGLVVFADVALDFVEDSEKVFSRSVIGEEQSQEGFDLESWRLGSGPRPLAESLASLGADGVDVAGSTAAVFLVGGGAPEFDELLWFGVEETLGLGPGVAEASLGLVCEFVARSGFEIEEGKDRIRGCCHSWRHGLDFTATYSIECAATCSTGASRRRLAEP